MSQILTPFFTPQRETARTRWEYLGGSVVLAVVFHFLLGSVLLSWLVASPTPDDSSLAEPDIIRFVPHVVPDASPQERRPLAYDESKPEKLKQEPKYEGEADTNPKDPEPRPLPGKDDPFREGESKITRNLDRRGGPPGPQEQTAAPQPEKPPGTSLEKAPAPHLEKPAEPGPQSRQPEKPSGTTADQPSAQAISKLQALENWQPGAGTKIPGFPEAPDEIIQLNTDSSVEDYGKSAYGKKRTPEAAYFKGLYEKIARAWRANLAATDLHFRSGHVIMLIRVARDGRLTAKELRRFALRDESVDLVRRSIAKCSPYVPFPPELDREAVEYRVGFYYQVTYP